MEDEEQLKKDKKDLIVALNAITDEPRFQRIAGIDIIMHVVGLLMLGDKPLMEELSFNAAKVGYKSILLCLERTAEETKEVD